MAPPRLIPPDNVLLEEARNHTVQADIARSLGFNAASLTSYLHKNHALRDQVHAILEENRAKKREGQFEQAKKHADELTLTKEIPATETVDVDPDSDQVRAFMKERGIPLDEWVATNVQVRRYPIQLGEGRIEEAQYLSVACKRKTGMTILNVAPPPPTRKVATLRSRKGEPEVTVLMGCDQAPFHDERAHELVCGPLALLQPHRVVHLGDLLDFPSVSKYKANPEYRASVADCHVAAHRLLLERTQASPDSAWHLLPGNHDHRLPDYLRGGLPAEIADLAPVGESDPWWHPRRMLHLEALGVDYVDPVQGMWERAQVQLAPALVARHGWRTGKAVAARDTARELGVSFVCAHTHRQALTPVTVGRDGEEHLLWAMEVGCLCRVDGLGYVPGIPDWQQGVGVVLTWPDGTFQFEHAQIVDGAIRFRGQRLGPRQLRVAA